MEGTNPLYSIRMIDENEEPETYYHMGIIDYLVEYKCRKRTEVISKKCMAFNPRLDISV